MQALQQLHSGQQAKEVVLVTIDFSPAWSLS